MKVTNIEVIPVRMRFKKSYYVSYGLYRSEAVVVKMHTDEGIVGLGTGMTSPDIYAGTTVEMVATTVNNYLAPLVTGEDPFNVEKIIYKMDKAMLGHNYAKQAIDLALYDIMGKALGVPVYKLIGGMFIEKIPVCWSLSVGNIEETVKEAVEWVGKGIKCLKLKIGNDHKQDIECIKETRKAVGPEINMRVDANGEYTSDAAVKILRKMEAFDLQLIEQPVPAWDLEGMHKIADALDTPVMADESVVIPPDFLKVIQMRAADVIKISVAHHGGFYKAKQLAAIAKAAEIPIYAGGMIENGIGTSASGHFYTSTSNVRYEGEFHLGPFKYENDIVKNPEALVAKDGFFVVPQGPGLGVEIDEEMMAKYRFSLDF
jgi:muconate/chloromuconate cycloisomerase